MGIFGIAKRGLGMLAKNKKASGSYILTDPSPKIKVTNPDTIKLNKQLKTIKRIGSYTANIRLHREVSIQYPFDVIPEKK